MLKKLKPGSTIAVVAPAFPPDSEKTKKGIKYLEKKGFKIRQGKSLSGRKGYLSASDEQRAREINECFADSEVDAIFCARGGWGTLRILDRLDYGIIKKNPKLLVGYSDITSLQLALWQKCKIPSVSGPMVSVEMGSGILDFTAKHFWDQLENTAGDYSIELSKLKKTETLTAGECSGVLLGGCLSLVAHQLGTPYSPDYRNALLFLEDVGEKPYKIDRYLAQLRQAGVFNKIVGLIAGEFIDCDDENGFTVKEIINQYTRNHNFPVLFNFPYGHQARKISIPVGVKAYLDTNKKILQFGNPFS